MSIKEYDVGARNIHHNPALKTATVDIPGSLPDFNSQSTTHVVSDIFGNGEVVFSPSPSFDYAKDTPEDKPGITGFFGMTVQKGADISLEDGNSIMNRALQDLEKQEAFSKKDTIKEVTIDPTTSTMFGKNAVDKKGHSRSSRMRFDSLGHGTTSTGEEVTFYKGFQPAYNGKTTWIFGQGEDGNLYSKDEGQGWPPEWKELFARLSPSFSNGTPELEESLSKAPLQEGRISQLWHSFFPTKEQLEANTVPNRFDYQGVDITVRTWKVSEDYEYYMQYLSSPKAKEILRRFNQGNSTYQVYYNGNLVSEGMAPDRESAISVAKKSADNYLSYKKIIPPEGESTMSKTSQNLETVDMQEATKKLFSRKGLVNFLNQTYGKSLSWKDLEYETFGKKTFAFIFDISKLLGMDITRQEVSDKMRSMGFIGDDGRWYKDSKVAMSLPISYFKAWHWDESIKEMSMDADRSIEVKNYNHLRNIQARLQKSGKLLRMWINSPEDYEHAVEDGSILTVDLIGGKWHLTSHGNSGWQVDNDDTVVGEDYANPTYDGFYKDMASRDKTIEKALSLGLTFPETKALLESLAEGTTPDKDEDKSCENCGNNEDSDELSGTCKKCASTRSPKFAGYSKKDKDIEEALSLGLSYPETQALLEALEGIEGQDRESYADTQDRESYADTQDLEGTAGQDRESYTDDQDRESYGSNGLDIHKVVYASDGEAKYRVVPIYQNEALVTLKSIDSAGEETGERTRVPMGDLIEFYTLSDREGNVLSFPEGNMGAFAEAKKRGIREGYTPDLQDVIDATLLDNKQMKVLPAGKEGAPGTFMVYGPKSGWVYFVGSQEACEAYIRLEQTYNYEWMQDKGSTSYHRPDEDGDTEEYTEAKKKWIQKAVSKMKKKGTEGSLTKAAKKAGESTKQFAKEHQHSKGKIGQKARFAVNVAKSKK